MSLSLVVPARAGFYYGTSMLIAKQGGFRQSFYSFFSSASIMQSGSIVGIQRIGGNSGSLMARRFINHHTHHYPRHHNHRFLPLISRSFSISTVRHRRFYTSSSRRTVQQTNGSSEVDTPPPMTGLKNRHHHQQQQQKGTENPATSAQRTTTAAASSSSSTSSSFWERFWGPKEMPERYTFAWYREMVLICTVFGITGTSTMVVVSLERERESHDCIVCMCDLCCMETVNVSVCAGRNGLVCFLSHVPLY